MPNDTSGGDTERTLVEPYPDCEMPDCSGDDRDDTHVVRDPENNVLNMCDSCLADGWRGVVEVLDS